MDKNNFIGWLGMVAFILLTASCNENDRADSAEVMVCQSECSLDELTGLPVECRLDGVQLQVTSAVTAEETYITALEETFSLTSMSDKKPDGRAADNKSSGSASGKKKTVVRTTVKNTDYSVFSSRSAVPVPDMTPDKYLAMVLKMYAEDLMNGHTVSFKVRMTFEGLRRDRLLAAVSVPPYSLYIKDENCHHDF